MQCVHNLRRLGVFCLLTFLLAAGGCGKKIWVSQYPPFYTHELKTILVADFRNATNDPQAGRIMSEKVAAALAANGTYEVLHRSDLKLLANEAELRAAGGDVEALARLLRKRGRAQAILTGAVTQYGAWQHTEWQQRPIYDRKDKKKRKILRYEAYLHARNEAAADATARLIRVSDGAVIHATPLGAAKAKVDSETGDEGFQAPDLSPQDCLDQAANQSVAKLLEEFAVVRKQISVARDAFRTAAGFRDGKWRGGKEFRPTDEVLLVVIDLPPECDRNHFRISIEVKDTGQEVAGLEFTWLRQWSHKEGKEFPFSPDKIVAAAGGGGEFVAKLYSGAEAVLDTKFKIEPGQ